MLHFIQNNFVTIIVLLVVAACIFLAIRKIIKDKKAGIGVCGQRCADCPYSQNCKDKFQGH